MIIFFHTQTHWVLMSYVIYFLYKIEIEIFIRLLSSLYLFRFLLYLSLNWFVECHGVCVTFSIYPCNVLNFLITSHGYTYIHITKHLGHFLQISQTDYMCMYVFISTVVLSCILPNAVALFLYTCLLKTFVGYAMSENHCN